MVLELLGGAALGAVSGESLRALLDFRKRVINFDGYLEGLDRSVKLMRTSVNDIERFDTQSNIPNRGPLSITDALGKAEELIRKCRISQRWSFCKKASNSNKLKEMDATLNFYPIYMLITAHMIFNRLILERLAQMGVGEPVSGPNVFDDPSRSPDVPDSTAGLNGMEGRPIFGPNASVDPCGAPEEADFTVGSNEMENAGLGAAFDELLTAVLECKGKTINFKSKLERLESKLNLIRSTVGEIENLNENVLEEEVKIFTHQLKEGTKLVRKCSKIKPWNILKKASYSTKIEELEESLGKFFLTSVQALQTRDSKKILVKLDEMSSNLDERRVSGPNEFVGPCGAPEVSDSTVGLDENMEGEPICVAPEVADFTVGSDEMENAGLGAAFDELLEAVRECKGKAINFKSILERLESKLNLIRSTVGEIENLNENVLEEEIKIFTHQLKGGTKLVRKCSKIKPWNILKKASYSTKIKELEVSLEKFLLTNVQALQTRDSKKILVKLDEMNSNLDERWVSGPNESVGPRGAPIVADSTVGLDEIMEGEPISVAPEVADFTVGSGEMDSKKILEKLDERWVCVPGVFVGSCEAPRVPDFIVGLDVPLQELKMKLLEDGVQVVVLSAPGGCGKTTLATMLCHDVEIKAIFMDNIFFVTVSKRPNLKDIVQKMFRHKNVTVPMFQNEDDAINQLEILLKQIGPGPILLVLDDVWPGSESLIHKFMFQIPRYKILVTSRSQFPRFNSTYKLEVLSDQDAMALFRHSAFSQGSSINIPEDLAQELVRGCMGFPLALRVVGESLRGRPEVIWRRTLNQWSEGQSIFDSNSDLLIRLKTSIDALDEKTNVKESFLDLGSFPEGQSISATALIDLWVELYNLDEDGLHALAIIYELASRNLVNLVSTRKDPIELDGYYNEHFVTQHDVLRDLAIHLSSQNPIEQRKRLIMDIRGNDLSKWSNEQIQPFHARLLSISTDENFSSSWFNIQLPEIKVLILNFQTGNYSLPEFMEKMDQLKVLIVTNYGLCPAKLGNFPLLGSLSSLKRMRLENVSVSFLSKSTLQFSNLRKISLIMCEIGEAFRNCTIDIPHMFPNLVEIDIDCCIDLVELPEGLCDIACLKKLSITKCHDLEALPEGFGRLTSLEMLRLHACTNLSGLPESIGNLHELRVLDISDCLSISELPKGIGGLSALEKLDMRGCEFPKLPPSVKDLCQLKVVICDKESSDLWEPFKTPLTDLKINVLNEDINLNWLPNLHF